MRTVAGRHNRHLAYLRRLGRRRVRQAEGVVLVEGPRLAGEVARAGLVPRLAVVCPDLLPPGGLPPALETWLEEAGVTLEVPPGLFGELAHTESPQGLLAVVDEPSRDPAPALEAPRAPVLVLDRVRDPGNVGALVRSAHALGAAAVLTVPATGDPLGPKALRAAAGATFRIPVARPLPAPDLAGLLVGGGFRLVGADPRGALLPWEADLAGKVALVIGNETAGLDPAFGGAALIGIPMPGGAESLNAAAAGAVLLYEALRQRAGSGLAPTPERA